MNRLKVFLPILLALIIAAGGSFVLYQWMERQTGPKEIVKVKEVDAVPVVVSNMDLEWGTVLRKEMLRSASFLPDSLPSSHFSKPEELVGRVLTANLEKNDPVTDSRLAPEDYTTGGVSAVLEDGMRAISVRGNKVMGISGFIQPGNRVDVLLTIQNPDTGKDITKLVMDNVPILATGSRVVESEEGKQAPVDVYTLKVTPEQAERLTLAASRGQLQFALRNIKDREEVLTRGAGMSEILASLSLGKPLMEEDSATEKNKAPAPQPKKVSVEIINGDSRVTKNL